MHRFGLASLTTCGSRSRRAYGVPMATQVDEWAWYDCPCCGEAIRAVVDPSAGERQQYVEDCPVCCRPLLLHIEIDDEGLATVDAESESGC